jgi:hypothetical protein
MDNRNLRLVLAGTGVAAIATLVLTVSLWPEKNKEQSKSTNVTNTANAADRNASGRDRAGNGLATASKPATGAPNVTKPVTVGLNSSDPAKSGIVATPPISETISKAYVRDPKTGQMKEVPVTISVMMLKDADGKPHKVAARGSLANPDGTPNTSGKVEPIDGATVSPLGNKKAQQK